MEATVQALRQTDGFWEWFYVPRWRDSGIKGKYLFFSKDRETLTRIALELIGHHGFMLAKIPMQGKSRRDDYVLCAYWPDASRQNEMYATYGNLPGLKIRAWKSDEQTLREQEAKREQTLHEAITL